MNARQQLPQATRALLFDVDGVLTDTASVHQRAWKETFDKVLADLGQPEFESLDYERYVDGRPRLDGVRTFLQSRALDVPEGTPADAAGTLTVEGIGRAKNELVLELIRSGGVVAYPGSVALAREARRRGIPAAVVSSSANAREVLRTVGLEDCFDTWVDGVRIERDGIPGKPSPDTFLTAAADLGVDPSDAVVLEDAIAGVAAGRAGGFGCVVGVDRAGQADALREAGADIVVDDLAELELPA